MRFFHNRCFARLEPLARRMLGGRIRETPAEE
jgi:hypothetical protein